MGSLTNEYEYEHQANINMGNYKSGDKNININECQSNNDMNLTDNHYKMIDGVNTGNAQRNLVDTVHIYMILP